MIRIVCLPEGAHGADLKVGRVIIWGIYFWRKKEVKFGQTLQCFSTGFCGVWCGGHSIFYLVNDNVTSSH